MSLQKGREVAVEQVDVSAYTIPTEEPEADGTLLWDSTTIVVVEVHADGKVGLGYTYSHAAAAHVIESTLADLIAGYDALSVNGAWHAMQQAVRNFGRPGIAASAIAAVDVALWDLKARLLDLPLVTLLGDVHDHVPVYGSGGFASYTEEEVQEQLSAWVDEGIDMVKMKVGWDPEEDVSRVEAAREAIGEDASLFVDANGAYSRKDALWFAGAFADYGVTWFEEPVSSDDLKGMRLLCDRVPWGMEIAGGEYGYDLFYFRRLLESGAVDVLQADATRCGGFSGFMQAATLCEAFNVGLSAHTAPNLHVHAACAVAPIRHIEYFHDHVQIEKMFFEGVLTPEEGAMQPDRSRPGMGLTFKRADAAPYQVYG